MLRAFCFSLSCRLYSLSLRRRRTLLGGAPGGVGRRSTAHLGVKQRSPFKNSFIPCRRQSRQTGPVYRAIVLLDAPLLGWATAVVRGGRAIDDRGDLEPGGLQRADSRLATCAGTANEDAHLAHAVLHRLSGRGVGSQTGGI